MSSSSSCESKSKSKSSSSSCSRSKSSSRHEKRKKCNPKSKRLVKCEIESYCEASRAFRDTIDQILTALASSAQPAPIPIEVDTSLAAIAVAVRPSFLALADALINVCCALRKRPCSLTPACQDLLNCILTSIIAFLTSFTSLSAILLQGLNVPSTLPGNLALAQTELEQMSIAIRSLPTKKHPKSKRVTKAINCAFRALIVAVIETISAGIFPPGVQVNTVVDIQGSALLQSFVRDLRTLEPIMFRSGRCCKQSPQLACLLSRISQLLPLIAIAILINTGNVGQYVVLAAQSDSLAVLASCIPLDPCLKLCERDLGALLDVITALRTFLLSAMERTSNT